MPSGPEIWIVLLVVVLLFGGSQLPKLARSLGEAKREFERGQDETTPTAKANRRSKAKGDAETEATNAATTDDEQA